MDFAVTGEAGTEADLDRLTPISLVGPLSLASLQTLVNRRLNKDAAAHAAALKDKSLRARAARFRTSDRQAGSERVWRASCPARTAPPSATAHPASRGQARPALVRYWPGLEGGGDGEGAGAGSREGNRAPETGPGSSTQTAGRSWRSREAGGPGKSQERGKAVEGRAGRKGPGSCSTPPLPSDSTEAWKSEATGPRSTACISAQARASPSSRVLGRSQSGRELGANVVLGRAGLPLIGRSRGVARPGLSDGSIRAASGPPGPPLPPAQPPSSLPPREGGLSKTRRWAGARKPAGRLGGRGLAAHPLPSPAVPGPGGCGVAGPGPGASREPTAPPPAAGRGALPPRRETHTQRGGPPGTSPDRPLTSVAG